MVVAGVGPALLSSGSGDRVIRWSLVIVGDQVRVQLGQIINDTKWRSKHITGFC